MKRKKKKDKDIINYEIRKK